MNQLVFIGREHSVVSVDSEQFYYVLHRPSNKSVNIPASEYTQNVIDCYPKLAYESALEQLLKRYN